MAVGPPVPTQGEHCVGQMIPVAGNHRKDVGLQSADRGGELLVP